MRVAGKYERELPAGSECDSILEVNSSSGKGKLAELNLSVEGDFR